MAERSPESQARKGAQYAIQQVGGWRKLQAALKLCEKEGLKAQKRAVREGAEVLLKAIKHGLDTSAPGGRPLKPLSPFTLAVRRLMGIRGQRPLLARRNLRRSLTVKKMSNGDVFVGVPNDAKTPEGKSLAEIAAIHEFGAAPRVVTFTPEQIKFLGVVASKIPASKRPPSQGSGKGFVIIRTPARPAWRTASVPRCGRPGACRNRPARHGPAWCHRWPRSPQHHLRICP